MLHLRIEHKDFIATATENHILYRYDLHNFKIISVLMLNIKYSG